MEGMKAFGYFGLFKVTRCKSGTDRGLNLRNGYAHPQKSIACNKVIAGKPSSHRFLRRAQKHHSAQNTVGAAVRRFDLPAMRTALAIEMYCLTVRLREQARSHRITRMTRNKVGYKAASGAVLLIWLLICSAPLTRG